MKKELFVLTLVIILFGLFWAIPVSAQTAGDYEYAVIDGEASVTNYQGDGGEVVIPCAFDQIPVTAISAFAFAGCDNITTLTVPDTVTTIGNSAFFGCTALSFLTVGVKVHEIGAAAFGECTALTNIAWNAANACGFAVADQAFAHAGTAKTGIRVVFGDSVETIPHHLFFAEGAAPNITAVVIGKNVTSIGDYAFPFCGCDSLIIPDRVESIGNGAFVNGKFSSLILGGGLREIGKSAFFCCKKLTSVTIPGSVIKIGNGAFRFCDGLSQLRLKEGIAEIADVAFADCPALNDVTVPKSVTVIGDEAFGFGFSGSSLVRYPLTINGYTYSAAQRYAGESGFSFISLGGAFSDVAADVWYGPCVDDLVARGIIGGYDNDDGTYSFRPGQKITRAEFAVILARAAHVDLTSYANKSSFSDVSASGWAASGIEWAFQNGIVSGIGNGKYAPNTNITRQDMAVMILRFARAEKIELPQTAAGIRFADAESIAPYAAEAVGAMQRAGIINGVVSTGKAYFKGTACASRAEAAKMISRLLAL